ncbi:hypothetical protein ACQQ2N_07750 [Dokdonella sp. MW10]|uniref:hypothetical protein n=1 Tax=Dokdonella sp. MW10 TaxID=2992926 RepID=UPI003F7FA157
MNPLFKRYLRDTGPASLAYFASVVAAALLASRLPEGWPRWLAALLPVPSILWMARVEILRLRRRDELRKRIEVEAMTIAFSVSFCVLAMLSFLDLFGGLGLGLPVAAMILAFAWIGAQLWVRARYRYWWSSGAEDES